MTSASTSDIVAELQRRSSFMFVSHVKPDGDTLGAGLALGIALKALGKRVGYFQQDPVPRILRFLPDTQYVSREVPADLPADTLWVFCDMSDSTRAGEFLPEIARRNMLNIDHHLGNSMFAGLNYILEKEASTGTCVLRILKAMKAPVTPEIATCILTTIMTDTGAFMHTNTTADVLKISAEMMDCGADKPLITEWIFANKRFAATKLIGMALGSARLEEDGRYCWTVVDDAMLAACGADGEDTEEIVQHLRAIEGVEAAALFKDFDGAVRVSLRSGGKINVQLAAATFNGGGHFMASGLTFPGTIDEAIAGVRAALKAQGL
jgi:phosphoesterase RecJ-like protein